MSLLSRTFCNGRCETNEGSSFGQTEVKKTGQFTEVCLILPNAVFTLDAGPLARCQCSEGPATDNFDTGFLSWFPCVLKANAEVVPKYPRCHYMLLM